MILLDTDHVTVLKYPENPQYEHLLARLQSSPEPVAVTIVTIEEQLRGWLALINRMKDVHKQVRGYERLAELFHFFAAWHIVRFDDRAAGEFSRLRRLKVRIGAMDVKNAAIALVHDVLLLSANLRDYSRVPGLKVDSWLR